MVLDGELDEGVRPLQLELFADPGAMELDRADAQTEDVGDLLAGLVLRHLGEATLSSGGNVRANLRTLLRRESAEGLPIAPCRCLLEKGRRR